MQVAGKQLKDGSVLLTKLKAGGVTAGSVLFAAAANALTEDNANFSYDGTLHKLTLGLGAIGADALPGRVLEIRGHASAPVTFGAAINAYEFDAGKWDPVLRWGFNLKSNGSRVDTTKGQISEAFEGYYVVGGIAAQEWHIEGKLADGTDKRWLSLNSKEASGYSLLSFVVDEFVCNTTDAGSMQFYGGVGVPLFFKTGGGAPANNAKTGIGAWTSTKVLAIGINSTLVNAGTNGAGPDGAQGSATTTYDSRNDYAAINHVVGSAGVAAAASVRIGVRGYLGVAGAFAGGTGAQTQNTGCGVVKFAAGASSLVVTNNLCDRAGISGYQSILATVMTNDTTMKSVVAVPGNGNFTLYANAAATGTTEVFWLLVNPDA